MSSIEVGVLVGVVLGLLSIIFHLSIIAKETFYFTPRTLYRLTEMNWFGCFLVSLLAWIFNPIYCSMMIIGYIIYTICEFVYWILHVGRKG